ncbi:hypothetical protein [Actinokineospora globicatena]|uniref:hypothetical protein n=1 Tax=Actinokineospora globicatena TaxID=103729 RepID=UPI00255378C2|nr:hypothetical protein [Actinokineospora globicatena]
MLTIVSVVADVSAILAIAANTVDAVIRIAAVVAVVLTLWLLVRLWGQPLRWQGMLAVVGLVAGSVVFTATFIGGSTTVVPAAGAGGGGTTTSGTTTTTPSTTTGTTSQSRPTSVSGGTTTPPVTSASVAYNGPPVEYPISVASGVAVDLDVENGKPSVEGGPDFDLYYESGLPGTLYFSRRDGKVSAGMLATFVARDKASPEACANSALITKTADAYSHKPSDVVCVRTSKNAWAIITVQRWGSTSPFNVELAVSLWRPSP